METSTETTAPATTTKAPRKTGKRAEKTPLKSICSQLRIDPKKARRILRKAGLSFHVSKERWLLTDSQAAKVRDILKPPKAAKAAAPAADKPN